MCTYLIHTYIYYKGERKKQKREYTSDADKYCDPLNYKPVPRQGGRPMTNKTEHLMKQTYDHESQKGLEAKTDGLTKCQ
jgi:hypothetical protein